jgi:3',5'-cyclic AMP phosphodiesterase CpdA
VTSGLGAEAGAAPGADPAPGEPPGEVSPVLRLAHVSDIHVGAQDEAALTSLAADLREAGVDATIVTGDLTMRARTREFHRATELISTLPAPHMVLIGNHDISLTNPLRRLFAPYDKFRAQVTPELDPVLDLDGGRIQGLQTMPRWRWKSGRVSKRQALLVRTSLGSAPHGVARIVAMHHPPSLGRLEVLAGRRALEHSLAAARVDVMLAGHTHVPGARELPVRDGSGGRRTVIEVVAGTATSHRTREGTSRSWSEVVIRPDRVDVTAHLDTGAGWHPGPGWSFPRSAG